jgi:hypothetical protein
MKPTIVLLCLQLLWGAVLAGEVLPGDTTVAQRSSKAMPAVQVAHGAMNFIGDVGYNRLNEPLLHRFGYEVSVRFFPKSILSPSVYFLTGKVGANEKTSYRALNFETPLNGFGASLSYRFDRPAGPRKILVPFITVGIEYLSFTPKGDLKSAEGTDYYYWSDGTIRDIDQQAPNAASAQLVHRDYTYETNLRDANLDGIGNYSLGAISIPAGAGLQLNLSGRCALVLSTTVHFASTDYLDNISDAGTGTRQGNSRNDRFVFTSAALAYDLGAPRDTPKKKKYRNKDYRNVDFNVLAKEDRDNDGVPDIEDEDPDSPPNVAVDSKGRPLDSDQDGVPDYRDKEMNSARGALVNEDGVTLTEEMMEERYVRDSLAAAPVAREYVRRIDVETAQKGIPPQYRGVDTDQNGVISAKEISDAIDLFLAGKSSFDTNQFYRLIDYYFSQ